MSSETIKKRDDRNSEKNTSSNGIYKKGSNGNYHEKNKLNDLTGKEWLFFTKTVFRTNYPSEFSHNLRKEHHANKPPRLMKEIIEFFTKSNQILLDPFMGVGGTLLGASLCDRNATGIEINEKWIQIYEKVCLKNKINKQNAIHGDTLKVMASMKDEGKKFDFIVTDPPYSPALEKTLCDEKYGRANRKSNLTSFSDNKNDFRNSDNFEEYYRKMEKAGKLMFELLRNKKYIALMIRDSYQNGKYINASSKVAERFENVGLTLKGIKIWYQVGSPMRPYGYPYAYVPNIIHHNILIFRKE